MVNKKILVGVALLLALFAVLIILSAITKESVSRRFSEFETRYDGKKAAGYDVSEAKVHAMQAKYLYNEGKYRKASKLLDIVFEDLEKAEIPAISDILTKGEVNVETICTDGIDNDGDGLIDNEDGDCWIRDGAVFMENYYKLISFNEYTDMIPELKNMGVKTIEMMPIWEHCNSNEPSQRCVVRNYSKLDPDRGDEYELKAFLDAAHYAGIGVVACIVECNTGVPPTPECGYYDKDGIGAALYQYQIQNPNKYILVRNSDGDFVCSIGYGYALNMTSNDTIEFFKDVYRQIQVYGFDGQRLDAPVELTCNSNERINSWGGDGSSACYSCEGKPCPHPVEGNYSPIPLLKEYAKLKQPYEVFLGESPSTMIAKSNWFCTYPYYPPDTMVDEVAEVSESVSFPYLLSSIVNSKTSSCEFVEWLENEFTSHNRQRFRFVITWTRLGIETANFIGNDPRYLPLVTLVSTIPGIPKVTHYELFGSDTVDDHPKIKGDSIITSKIRRNHWKKVLNIRNNSNALKYGSIKSVWKSGDHTYAYVREYDREKVIVVLNFLDKEAASTLDLSFLDTEAVLHDELNDERFVVVDPSSYIIHVPARGSRILVVEKEGD